MTPALPVPAPPTASAAAVPIAAALAHLARELSALAAEVRGHAASLTGAAAASGWHSTAAAACRARLADLALDLLGAAALLEQASEVVDDHARTASHRASLLAAATTEVLTAGVAGVFG